MKLTVPLRALFDHPVTALQSAMAGLGDPVWAVADWRRHHAVHSQTRSILFRWLANDWVPGSAAQVRTYEYAPRPLAEAAEAVAAKLAAHFGGQVVKLMLAELGPGAEIAPHQDLSPALFLAHRCHLPIVTNPDVDFFIDEVAHHLQPGVVYEFDNTRAHAVANRGATPRVHLICDILPDPAPA